MKDEIENDREKLMKKQEKLYTKLISTFSSNNQFILLNKLIDTEIELEKLCNY